MNYLLRQDDEVSPSNFMEQSTESQPVIFDSSLNNVDISTIHDGKIKSKRVLNESERIKNLERMRKLRVRRKEQEIAFWRSKTKLQRAVLKRRLWKLTGNKYKGRQAGIQLATNLTEDVHRDFISDNPDDVEKALHYIDFSNREDAFSKDERESMKKWTKRLDGKEYAISSPLISMGERYLSKEEKARIRSKWPKTDQDCIEIAKMLEKAYRHGKTLEKREERARKKAANQINTQQ